MLSVDLRGEESVQYTLVNALGQVEFNGILKQGLNQLDLHELIPGVYFIKSEEWLEYIVVQ